MNFLRQALILVSIALSLSLNACRGESVAITPSFEVNKYRASVGSPLELVYRFEMAAEGNPIFADYKVFVHFVDAEGELLFTDDHEPSPPSSAWELGSTIEYARTIFVPHLSHSGATAVEMGLYDPETGQRQRLTGKDSGQLAYRVGHMMFENSNEELSLEYTQGWYEPETSPEDPSIQWRWTEKKAVSTFMNPRVDSVLYLRTDTNVKAFDDPLEVTITTGGMALARFRVADADPTLRRIFVPASAMGSGDQVEVQILVNKTFAPSQTGASDTRQLGLRVYRFYVDPQRHTSFQLEGIYIAQLERPSQPYRRQYEFTEDWYTWNIPIWKKALAPFKGKPNIHYLEVGVFEGRSAIWMLENILTHPSSTLTGADAFFPHGETDSPTLKQRFIDNLKRAGARDRATVIQGLSQVQLRKLPLNHFDIIYIDGSHKVDDVLEDAILSHRLLRKSGIMIFDDYEWPRDPGVNHAVNLFVQIYGQHYDIIHCGYQVILRKTT